MAALLSLMPALAAADFADFVGTAKEATKKPLDTTIPQAGQLGFLENLSTFWERHSPYDFVYEFLAVLGLFIYVGLYFVGNGANEKLAKAKFKSIYRQLADNFALVGLQADAAPLSKDTSDSYISYVSGRKNVESGDITISTFPRHDVLIGLPLRAIYGVYFDQESIKDRLTISFKLPAAFDGFVFGVLHKNVMRYQRSSNWDLQFTRTNDAPFSSSFVYMTEAAEITEKLMSKELIQVITDMEDSLEYIVLSDQPTKQPSTAEQDKSSRVLKLSVLLDAPSATEDNVNMLLASVLNIADALPKSSNKLTANTLRKLSLAREDTYKAIAKKVAAEEAEDAPKRLTRKEIREKEKKAAIGKLPAKEQKKALEKERERQLKRGQSKMSKKA